MLTWLLIIMILNSLILSVIAAGAAFMTYDTVLENRENKKRLQAQKECDECDECECSYKSNDSLEIVKPDPPPSVSVVG